MIDESSVLAGFRSVPGLRGEWRLEAMGEKTFRAGSEDRSVFVKWIAADDRRGQNEIEVNRSVLTGASIACPGLLHVIPCGADRLAVWEWVDGSDLRSTRRNSLPEAFRKLGAFHASQRGAFPVSSPISGNEYESIQALIDGETGIVCAGLPPTLGERCTRILQSLSCGYPTLIHGDMHPGNLIASAAGPVFVDWGFARRSINLFDLDYVESRPIQPAEAAWWVIRPEEAEAVFKAYFPACGLAEADAMEIHRAVMVWAALWSLYNAGTMHDSNRAVSQQRLEYLVEVLA
jgi:Ser/Thr protein kinase RdoA (MazF antagonist)